MKELIARVRSIADKIADDSKTPKNDTATI